MTRLHLFLTVLGLLLFPGFAAAQVVDATVCDVLANPPSFDGKVVRLKGVVIAGFEEFAVKGAGCHQIVNAIWLDYPEGTRGKAGPLALLRLQLAKNNPATVTEVSRPPITLDKNKDFKDFDNLLSTPAKTSTLCLGCVKFVVTATLVGRIDGSKSTGLVRDGAGKVIGIGGFGNLNNYSARLVLQSVSDISSQEIDYAKGGVTSSSDALSREGSYTPGSPTADQLKKAADAFGGPGEQNGVIVGFGGTNEIPKGDTAKSSENSPDGLVFVIAFDGDRVKGPSMQIAISHLGTHIADLRNSAVEIPSLPLYGAEFRAWQTSVLSAVNSKVKALTLPGGYAVYNQAWPGSELGKNANDGIAGYLQNWTSIANPPKP